MISKRPSVMIYTNRADRGMLTEICAGMEEEGVFCEITEREETSVQQLAYAAANDSMLGCGIGLSEHTAVLTVKGLSAESCVQRVESPEPRQCRNLGTNGARAVKKQPFRD